MMQFSSETITFRLASIADCKLYFDWVNETMVRRNAHNPAPVKWENHEKWFENKIHSGTLMIIFFDGKTPIGQARIESVEGKGIIDYSVDKNYRGMNVGVSMLNMLKNLIQKLTRVGTLKAEVKSENVASIKAFEKAGFALVSNDNINGVDCRVFEYKV